MSANQAVALKPRFLHSTFWPCDSGTPYVFIAPSRFVQGDGISKQFAKYLAIIPSKNPAILATKSCRKRMEPVISDSFKSLASSQVSNIPNSPLWIEFPGECCYDDINAIYHKMSQDTNNNSNKNKNSKPKIDCIISIGGGKCIDGGKLLAYYLDNIPFVAFPTIASNDGPCAACSIMYDKKTHATLHAFRYPQNPCMVIVDTNIIANAPKRYFISGIGDAMATYFETRTCYNNPNAKTTIGVKITQTAMTLSKLCANILFENGIKAKESIEIKKVTPEFEKCVEATVLLSGLGFESGGLAIAHTVARGMRNT